MGAHPVADGATGTERVLGVEWVPLAHAALCLDCEACFRLNSRGCPACGSRTWTLLAPFLQRKANGK